MRAKQFLASLLDPRAWAHLFRLVHFYNYSHVSQKRTLTMGPGTRLAPNASFRNSERVELGADVHVNTNVALWAGPSTGRIVIGDHTLLAPDVYITASNYDTAKGKLMNDQAMIERDVIIGRNVWLGRGVTVVPGVEIGDGCVVGAGAVVTKSLPADSIAVGIPARVVGMRQ